MRRRPAALLAAAVLALSPALAACSEEPQTEVTEEGVIETPTQQGEGGGLDAPSGEPLVPDSSAEPGAGVTSQPS